MNRKPQTFRGSSLASLLLLLNLSGLALGCAEGIPVPVQVPAGMTEADVYARNGAPAFVTATSDGGKLIVYEADTSYTTPANVYDTDSGKTVVPGYTAHHKRVTTYTVAANGAVRAITVTDN